jgi:hypothetical protein
LVESLIIRYRSLVTMQLCHNICGGQAVSFNSTFMTSTGSNALCADGEGDVQLDSYCACSKVPGN